MILSNNERHKVLIHLCRVSNKTITGTAINNAVSMWLTKTDAEIVQLMRDLQSQIEDNPRGMAEILGSAYDFVYEWRREPETLNLDYHIKNLILKAIERFPTRSQQAEALGISVRTLTNYFHQFSISIP